MKITLKLTVLTLGLLLTTLSFADELDELLQNDVNQMVQQTVSQNPGLFSATQISVLLPGEKEPRDYVAGTQTVLNSSAPATTNMLSQYGSITKEFTSALIIKYIDLQPATTSNKVTLQTSLLTLYPGKFSSGDWPRAWQNVTIEDLMHMTSGIPTYSSSYDAFDPRREYALDAFVEKMAAEENTQGCVLSLGCFPTGTQFFYSNTNYLLLGMIVEKLYRQPYGTVLDENILAGQRAQGNPVYYEMNYSPVILKRMLHSYWIFPTTSYIQHGEDITDLNLTYAASTGGLTGNSHALVNMIHNLFTNKILSPEQIQTLTQTGLVDPNTGAAVPFAEAHDKCTGKGCYGLGVVYLSQFASGLYGDIYVYEGSPLGYESEYFWFPKYNIVIGFTANSRGNFMSVPLSTMLAEMIQQVMAYVNPNKSMPIVSQEATERLVAILQND